MTQGQLMREMTVRELQGWLALFDQRRAVAKAQSEVSNGSNDDA